MLNHSLFISFLVNVYSCFVFHLFLSFYYFIFLFGFQFGVHMHCVSERDKQKQNNNKKYSNEHNADTEECLVDLAA